VSALALVILGASLVCAGTGIAAGVVMRPHDPWNDVFEVAAAATGLIAALPVLVVAAAVVALPSDVHGDQEAAVQLVFVAVLVIPLYAPCLAGAAAGKLLGRAIRRRD
jgi:hypothetical protein